MGLMCTVHETLPAWHSTKKWCSSVSKNIYILKDFKCMWESVMMAISIMVRVMMEEVVMVVVEVMEAVVVMVGMVVVGMDRRYNVHNSLNYMVTCVNAWARTCVSIG